MPCRKKKKRRKSRRVSDPYSRMLKTTANASSAIVGASATMFVATKAMDILKT